MSEVGMKERVELLNENCGLIQKEILSKGSYIITEENLFCENNGRRFEYDADRCPRTWREFYYPMYSNTGFWNDTYLIPRGNKDYIVHLNDVLISGDTFFSFKKGLQRSKKYEYYLGIINNDERLNHDQKKQLVIVLNSCVEMNYSYFNFVLMPRTGGMNNMKEQGNGIGVSLDRGDSFAYFLDEFFKSNDETILRYAQKNSRSRIKNYLEQKITSYEQYCKYFLLPPSSNKNSDLIFDMRENGKKAITTVENVIDYMNLAMRFWITRYNTLQEKVETNMNHLG